MVRRIGTIAAMGREKSGIKRWDDELKDLPGRRSSRVPSSDGVILHTVSYGSGGPAVVCCNGIGVSTFFWKYVARYFASQRQVVTWDYRGHNRSTKARRLLPANYTMERNAQDLLAVMDANGVEKAVLLGHSMGCQVILEFWRQFPDRVAGLEDGVVGPRAGGLEVVAGCDAREAGPDHEDVEVLDAVG